MKKILLITLTLLLLNVSQLSATEHDSCDNNQTDGHKHSHGIHKKIDDLDKRKIVRKKSLDKEHLLAIAQDKLITLVAQKKISKSWLNAYAPVITRTKYKFVNDYMVIFHNPKIKKEKYKNLYIFVNAYGDIQGVNYSGR